MPAPRSATLTNGVPLLAAVTVIRAGRLIDGKSNAVQQDQAVFVEDGTIWAADGTLLAQSRQLAILMRPAIG